MTKSMEEILNETLAPAMKDQVQEAFTAKLDEARAQIEESVRAELADRYEHDKSELVEAMDAMITDVVRIHEQAKAEEIAKLKEARAMYESAIADSKTATRARVKEMAATVGTLIAEALDTKYSELNEQKASIAEQAKTLAESVDTLKAKLVENHEAHLRKINEFVTSQVSRELTEFAQDKRALAETHVKLVSENKARLAEAQQRFLKEAAATVDAFVNESLNGELTQLHEDIERNRKNEFGRRIFEAVASEYMGSFLAEGSEVRKMQRVLEGMKGEITKRDAEAQSYKEKLDEAEKAVAAAQRRLVLESERAERAAIMGDLMASLRGDKRAVMESMLETVKTPQLKAQFDKFLPVVLSEGKAPVKKAKALTESKAAPAAATTVIATGDRQARQVNESVTEELDPTIAHIVSLANIRK